MGTVAGAKSVCQTAGAAERSSSTPRTGIDAGRATAGPSSIAPTSYATGNGACFQLQLFWAGLGNALYGPGASPKLLRRAASRAQRMPVLQRATGAAARVDSAAGEQRPSGVLVGASAAAGVHIPRRRGGGEPDAARRVELLDGRTTPGMPNLHLRLARSM
jgi:hypothetical protein